MMKQFILGLLLISFFNTTKAQDETLINLKREVSGLQKEMIAIKETNKKLTSSLESFKTLLKNQGDSIMNLRSLVNISNEKNTSSISVLKGNLDDSSMQSNKKITELDDSISKKTLYWIVAFLLVALCSFVIYFLLKKRITSESTEVAEKIASTKKVLEEEGIRLDNKLISILETQLKLMNEARKNPVIDPSLPNNNSDEPDHSLALKVADEIIRIQTNLSNMDPATKGLKQLAASVKRIQDNFQANGYDLVEMLNKPFDQGMNVVANFRPDETLKAGEQIITRIIKPQVNYKGVMIQSAQIEVSQGE